MQYVKHWNITRNYVNELYFSLLPGVVISARQRVPLTLSSCHRFSKPIPSLLNVKILTNSEKHRQTGILKLPWWLIIASPVMLISSRTESRHLHQSREQRGSNLRRWPHGRSSQFEPRPFLRRSVPRRWVQSASTPPSLRHGSFLLLASVGLRRQWLPCLDLWLLSKHQRK